MFQPNSIRSLLKKRNTNKFNQQNQKNQQNTQQMSKTFTNFNMSSKNSDPDLQALIQAKLMIKEIDHQVDSIRTWRQHQKQLLIQKLNSNKQLYNLSNEEYQNYLNEKTKQDKFQHQKLIQKMKIQQNKFKKINNNSFVQNSNAQTLQSSQGGQIIYEDWQNNLYDPAMMASITQAQDKINSLKHMKNLIGNQNLQDKHLAFLNSISQLSSNDIFQKKNNQNIHTNKINYQIQNNSIPFDKNILKKELQDIDKQLQEMEDLLKD